MVAEVAWIIWADRLSARCGIGQLGLASFVTIVEYPGTQELTLPCSDEYRKRKAAEADAIDKVWGFEKFGESEAEPRLGWLLNLVVTSVVGSDDVEHQALEYVWPRHGSPALVFADAHAFHRPQLPNVLTVSSPPTRRLFFLEQDGGTFKCTTTYNRVSLLASFLPRSSGLDLLQNLQLTMPPP